LKPKILLDRLGTDLSVLFLADGKAKDALNGGAGTTAASMTIDAGRLFVSFPFFGLAPSSMYPYPSRLCVLPCAASSARCLISVGDFCCLLALSKKYDAVPCVPSLVTGLVGGVEPTLERHAALVLLPQLPVLVAALDVIPVPVLVLLVVVVLAVVFELSVLVAVVFVLIVMLLAL
jgi:hypothetical protein